MRSFLKFFLASLVALVVFFGLFFLILVVVVGGIAGSLSSADKVSVAQKSVLVVDLARPFNDRKQDETFASLTGGSDLTNSSLYELVRVIDHAAKDSLIKGIYLKCNGNVNGFAGSEEIRNALAAFKKSKKFIIAYGDMINQKAYYVANIADHIYCHPKGGLEWKGFASQLFFMKHALDKLEIDPQIFYAGKFKSATEPLREEKMTDANRLQTSAWLQDLYNGLLQTTAQTRHIDTALLQQYANNLSVQTASDAVRVQLVDAVKYDDEIKTEIRERLGLQEKDKIEFIFPGAYAKAVNLTKYAKNRIAIIYAEGEIVYGRGTEGQVGSDEYKTLFAKIRTDNNIKAVVLRVNSPGGSSLASEIIWREAELIKKAGKPLVVSMGDLAASGGYYIAAGADSIFAQPNTITGSIGVFTIIPNLSGFFKNKLGITFDEVKTAQHAGYGGISKPLTDFERILVQAEIDTVYADFKNRVAAGRKKQASFVDSIAQGRIWTGQMALNLGLVDKQGSLQDAIQCAAGMADMTDYSIREYPEPKSLLDMLKSNYSKTVTSRAIREEIGDEQFKLFEQLKSLKKMTGISQARVPFDIAVE